MTNLKKIGSGFIFFIVGYFLVVILNYIIPYIVDFGEELYPETDFGGVIWMVVIGIWAIMTIFVPGFLILSGITEQDTEDSPMRDIITAVVLFIAGLLITIKANFIFTALASMADNGLIKALFWIGLIVSWGGIVLITPGYLVINAAKN